MPTPLQIFTYCTCKHMRLKCNIIMDFLLLHTWYENPKYLKELSNLFNSKLNHQDVHMPQMSNLLQPPWLSSPHLPLISVTTKMGVNSLEPGFYLDNCAVQQLAHIWIWYWINQCKNNENMKTPFIGSAFSRYFLMVMLNKALRQ